MDTTAYPTTHPTRTIHVDPQTWEQVAAKSAGEGPEDMARALLFQVHHSGTTARVLPPTNDEIAVSFPIDDEDWAAAEAVSDGDVEGLLRGLLNVYVSTNAYVIPHRAVHMREWHPYSHMTVRTAHEDGELLGHTLYVWGTGRGAYSTERGLRNAVARFADEANALGEVGELGAWEL